MGKLILAEEGSKPQAPSSGSLEFYAKTDDNLYIQNSAGVETMLNIPASKLGTSTLSAGTVTVANTAVTSNSLIFLTSQSDGGTPGFLRVTAKTASTSFVITSSSATDTSTVAWMIVEGL